MADPTTTIKKNLCGVPFRGFVFTCADKADGAESFPCTGSAHVGPDHLVCTCSCHDPSHDETCPDCGYWSGGAVCTSLCAGQAITEARQSGHQTEDNGRAEADHG